MTRFILVRHGESCANNDGVFAGHFNAELTELGLKQAEKTAEYIKENYKITKAYASDLKRAFVTGKTIADLIGIEIIPNENLREISAGEWEGRKFTDLMAEYKKDYDVWLKDIGNSRCTGGESVKELGARVLDELKKIANENPEETVLIATHATPIRVLQSMILKSLDEMKNIPWVNNTSVTELICDNGTWKFEKIGYDAHLEGMRAVFPANV